MFSVAKNNRKFLALLLFVKSICKFKAMTEEEAFEKVYSRRTSAMGTSLINEQDRDLGFGDKVAREILREAGNELGTAACAVIKKLKLQRSKIPIGLVGSVFRSGNLVTDPLLQTVQRIAPKAYLLDKIIIPAYSAAQMAYENNGNGRR